MRNYLIAAALGAAMLTGCGDGADSAKNGVRTSISEAEAGGARSGVSFSVKGSADYEARQARLVVAGLTDDGTVSDDAARYYSIQLIDGPRGEPRGTVSLFVLPDVSSGDYSLIDMLTFLGGESAEVGANYIHRKDGANTFFNISAPGEIKLTRNGDMLSGSFRFHTEATRDPDIKVEISGEFRDVALKSTIRN